MNIDKTIREQIKENPELNMALFACWGLAICALLTGNDPFSPLAVGFLITAIIDSKEKVN